MIASLLLLASRSVLTAPNNVDGNYGNISIYQVEPKFMPALVVQSFPVTVTNLPVGPSRVPSPTCQVGHRGLLQVYGVTFFNASDRTGLAAGDKRELRCGTVLNAFPHGRQPKYDVEATYISPFQVQCDLPAGLTCGGSSAATAFRLLEERSQPHA